MLWAEDLIHNCFFFSLIIDQSNSLSTLRMVIVIASLIMALSCHSITATAYSTRLIIFLFWNVLQSLCYNFTLGHSKKCLAMNSST
jgi:hypothetical protein